MEHKPDIGQRVRPCNVARLVRVDVERFERQNFTVISITAAGVLLLGADEKTTLTVPTQDYPQTCITIV